MKFLIQHVLNGNLAEARKQARKHSPLAIKNEMLGELWDFGPAKVELALQWLKTGERYQDFINAE
jgi:hypothetical protein